MPSPEKLAAFRDLIVGAQQGKVQVSEAASEVRSTRPVTAWLDANPSLRSLSNKTLYVPDSKTPALRPTILSVK